MPGQPVPKEKSAKFMLKFQSVENEERDWFSEARNSKKKQDKARRRKKKNYSKKETRIEKKK